VSQDSPEKTRARILEAARQAFAEFGHAGARVDKIASAAGCNKQLIYHYFGSKEGLREAVFRERLVEKGARITEIPQDLSGMLEHLFTGMRDDEEWIRMMLWERLSGQGCSGMAERRAHFEHFESRMGFVEDPALRPFVAVAMLGMAFFPTVMTQVPGLVVGTGSDEEFARRYREALRWIAARIAGSGGPGDANRGASAAGG
jgi:AcrR family transcriptional regulator